MKIIIDTNLWVSFLLKGHVYTNLLSILSKEGNDIVICQQSIDELLAVASRAKFRKYISEKQLTALISFLLQKAQIYYVDNIPARCRDPKDDYLLELAVASEADFLLTGDSDLLSMGMIGKCKITTVAQCLNSLEQ